MFSAWASFDAKPGVNSIDGELQCEPTLVADGGTGSEVRVPKLELSAQSLSERHVRRYAEISEGGRTGLEVLCFAAAEAYSEGIAGTGGRGIFGGAGAGARTGPRRVLFGDKNVN